MSESISAFMKADHQHCDQLFAQAEDALDSGDSAPMQAFLDDMNRHFVWEESVLFGAFEDATGMHGGGPTEVMRGEHTQMKALMSQMQEAITGGAAETALKAGETLLILMQQHNLKEENMLYPMMDSHLDAAAMVEKLKGMTP